MFDVYASMKGRDKRYIRKEMKKRLWKVIKSDFFARKLQRIIESGKNNEEIHRRMWKFIPYRYILNPESHSKAQDYGAPIIEIHDLWRVEEFCNVTEIRTPLFVNKRKLNIRPEPVELTLLVEDWDKDEIFEWEIGVVILDGCGWCIPEDSYYKEME